MDNDQNQIPQAPQPSSPQDDERELKRAQNLTIAASILGPVSLFFGTVLTSGAGIACAILALRKILKIEKAEGPLRIAAKRMKVLSIVTLVVCSLAFILSAITIWLLYPIVLEAVETGDYSALMNGSTGSGLGDGSTKGSSTWG